MAVFYNHEFGTFRDGLTGYTEVDTDPSGEITQGNTYVQLVSDDASLDTLGIHKSSEIISDMEGKWHEHWVTFESDGNFGVLYDVSTGIRTTSDGFGLNFTRGAYFECFRNSGLGTTLQTCRAALNGSVLGTVSTLEKATTYKFKIHVVSTTSIRYYIDGDAFDNQLIIDHNADITVGHYDRYQAYQTIGTGDNSSLRVYASYVHDEGLNFVPPVDGGGGSSLKHVRRRRNLWPWKKYNRKP